MHQQPIHIVRIICGESNPVISSIVFKLVWPPIPSDLTKAIEMNSLHLGSSPSGHLFPRILLTWQQESGLLSIHRTQYYTPLISQQPIWNHCYAWRLCLDTQLSYRAGLEIDIDIIRGAIIVDHSQ